MSASWPAPFAPIASPCVGVAPPLSGKHDFPPPPPHLEEVDTGRIFCVESPALSAHDMNISVSFLHLGDHANPLPPLHLCLPSSRPFRGMFFPSPPFLSNWRALACLSVPPPAPTEVSNPFKKTAPRLREKIVPSLLLYTHFFLSPREFPPPSRSAPVSTLSPLRLARF